MNKTILHIFSLFIISCTLADQSFSKAGGGMDAGGGDLHSKDFGAAWFLGPKPIRYCVEIDKQFGVSKEVAITEIQNAFKEWQLYINLKQNLGSKIVFNSGAVQKCDGSEDLSFYLGVENQDTQDAKRFYEQPVAFAHRKTYDALAGWGSGFIWLAKANSLELGMPDWSAEQRLKGIIVHELGHVLGNGHMEGTIMTGDIAQAMRTPCKDGFFCDLAEGFTLMLLRGIDSFKELLSCQDKCVYWTESYTFIASEPRSDASMIFQKFTGHPPVRQFSFGIQRTSDWSNIIMYFKDESSIGGPLGVTAVQSRTFQIISDSPFAVELFKVANGQFTYSAEAQSFVSTGSFEVPASNGEILNFILDYNMDKGPLTITFRDLNSKERIWRAVFTKIMAQSKI